MTMQSSIQETNEDVPIDADAAVEATIQGRSHGRRGEVEEAANENWQEENRTDEQQEPRCPKMCNVTIILVIPGLILSLLSMFSSDFVIAQVGSYKSGSVLQKEGLFRHKIEFEGEFIGLDDLVDPNDYAADYCDEYDEYCRVETSTKQIAQLGLLFALFFGFGGAYAILRGNKGLSSLFLVASIMQLVPFLLYVNHPMCVDAEAYRPKVTECKIGNVGIRMIFASLFYALAFVVGDFYRNN